MKLGEMKGSPVLTVEEGKSLGRIQGVLVDAAQRLIAYLVVQSSNWFEGPLAVPMDKVTGIGAAAVIVQSSGHVAQIAQSDRAVRLAIQNITIVGSGVYSPQGQLMGMVQDISFGLDGRLHELLMEDGGKVPVRDVLALGANVVFAYAGTERGSAAPSPLGGPMGVAAERPATMDTEDAMPVLVTQEQEPKKQERGLVGRTLLKDIEGNLGLIGRAGDSITREMIDIALDAGKLVELTTNSVQ